jgi:hypothetical protein
MKNLKIFSISLLLLLTVKVVLADSPVTSTIFYNCYSEYAIVMKAHKSGVMNDTIAEYLLNDTLEIGVKAAIINALSWDANGKDNAPLLIQYISKKYKLGKGFDMNLLSADDIFCLGYLSIMDNYNNTAKPISILKFAHEKKPKSYTISIILALAEAQEAMSTDWCQVYKLCTSVDKDKELIRDLRSSAILNIFNYINIYKSSCKEK